MNAITEALPATEERAATVPPAPGALWPEQGGRYVGLYMKDGKLHHGIITDGTDTDIITSFDDASDKIKGADIGGFTDWRAPDQREAMLAYVHARENFHTEGVESVYLTSAPYGADGAWIVDFEYGSVSIDDRDITRRVRLFRSLIA